jgi:hypothetical protein
MIAVEHLANRAEGHDGINSSNFSQIGSNSLLTTPDERQIQIFLTPTNVRPSWEFQFHCAISDLNSEQTRTPAYTKLIQRIVA